MSVARGPSIEVKTLTRRRMRDICESCLQFDVPEVKEGNLEPWTASNYLAELPGKWALSKVAYIGGDLVGYRIVSGRGLTDSFAHSHRTVVDRLWRRKGVALALLASSVAEAAAAGFEGISGKCHPENLVSQRFLEATGWRLEKTPPGENQLWVLQPLSAFRDGSRYERHR